MIFFYTYKLLKIDLTYTYSSKMSQKVDYNKSLMYKIVCKDTNIKNVYIGSTTSFKHRKSQHKYTCNNENDKHYNHNVYKFIRDNGGWNNFDMVLIDYTPCNTKLQLHKLERQYIEKIDNDLLLNKQLPTRKKEDYDKEWYENNKETLKEKQKKYRTENKETLKKKQKEYYQDNKKKCKESFKKYYHNNKKKVSENLKKARENYKEIIRNK